MSIRVKINCTYFYDGFYCRNKDIKRSLFGVGCRMCKEAQGKACELKNKKTIIKPIPIVKKGK